MKSAIARPLSNPGGLKLEDHLALEQHEIVRIGIDQFSHQRMRLFTMFRCHTIMERQCQPFVLEQCAGMILGRSVELGLRASCQSVMASDHSARHASTRQAAPLQPVQAGRRERSDGLKRRSSWAIERPLTSASAPSVAA